MFREKIMLPVLMVCFVSVTSCGQNKATDKPLETPTEEAVTNDAGFSKPQEYIGWHCPDNLSGFPPIDIQDYAKLKVVADRLPTLEETSNGTSLMYFNTAKIPDARPLKMTLPQVARIHSQHTGFNELIIVIQAAVAGTDTVLGFRYPSGGNGSARLGEATFLSDAEVAKLGPAPMVYLKSEIKASKERIWEAFTRTAYAKQLGERFKQQEFFRSAWAPDAQVNLKIDSDSLQASGIATTLWGNLYMQIDYERNGIHFTEKLFVSQNAGESSELHFVAGPYSKGMDAQQTVWKKWLQNVKSTSELGALITK